MIFQLYYLQITQKSVSLYCVFHSIRFKVNKDWLSGIDSLLFFIPPAFPFFDALYIAFSDNLSTFAFY